MEMNLIITIATFVGSAGIAWGISANKLKGLEIRQAIVEGEHKADHDLLIRLDEKFNILDSKVNLILQKLDLR
jgi:hypothetical protein